MKRVLFTIGSFVLGTLALFWFLSEVAVRYEMWSTGALSRSELGDDLGFGVLIVMLVVPASVIGGLIIGVKVWRHQAPEVLHSG